jgi:hypothetical protein
MVGAAPGAKEEQGRVRHEIRRLEMAQAVSNGNDVGA